MQRLVVIKLVKVKRSVKWNDPDLNIKWPINMRVLSNVDWIGNKNLRELFPEKFK